MAACACRGEDRDTQLGGDRPGDTFSWKTVTQEDVVVKPSHVQDYLTGNYTIVSKLNRFE